jgi:hypothetical protein
MYLVISYVWPDVLLILCFKSNRGLHYWEVANNSITLVDGQAEYTMFRSTGETLQVLTHPLQK